MVLTDPRPTLANSGGLRNENRTAAYWIKILLLNIFILVSAATSAAAQDWLVGIDDSVTPAPAGGPIDLPITVTNNTFGNVPATTVDIIVPPSTSFESFSGDITGCTPLPAAAGATVTCDVPALGDGESAELLFGIVTTIQGSVPITANLPDDANNANNSETKTLTFTDGAEVALSVVAPTTAAAGEIVDYTFTAFNNGPNDATDLTFTFEVPPGLEKVTPPAGCVLDGTAYVCEIPGPVPVGTGIDLTFEGQVVASSTSTLTAIASVDVGNPGDPNTSNNTVSTDLTVTPGSDLAMNKTLNDSAPLLVGETTSFTLTPTYTGEVPTNLTISDTVPANYTVTSVTTTGGWVCSFDAGTGLVECTNPGGSGVVGVDQSLGEVTINVTIDSEGVATNFATVGSNDVTDPVVDNNTGDDGGTTIEEPFIDLAVGKTGIDTGQYVVGEEYDFQLTATNLGNADYTGTVTLADILPVGLRITSVGGGWTCDPTPFTGDGTTPFNCTRVFTAGDPIGAADPITGEGTTAPAAVLTVEVLPSLAGGSFTNTASVADGPDSNFPDENPDNDVITLGGDVTDATNSADVTIVKTRNLATLAVGEVQTFDLEIVNNGPAVSEDVQVRDNITNLINADVGPNNAGFIAITNYANISAVDANCSTSALGTTGRNLSCDIASLPVCTQGTDCPIITVEVRPGGDGGLRTNTASAISYGTPDIDRTNDTDSVNYTVEARSDITVEKVANATEVAAGQLITYVITGTNRSETPGVPGQTVNLSTAANLTITDTLPSDMTFLSATPSVGACGTQPAANSVTGPGNNTVICNFGNVPVGVQQTVRIEARPNFILEGSSITNSVVIATDTTQVNQGGGDEEASVTTDITLSDLDLLVQKTDSLDPVAIDEETTYSVTIRNLGPSAAQNVRMTDDFPSSLIRILAVDDGDGDAGTDSCTAISAPQIGGSITCTYPYLPAGDSIVVTVTAEGDAKGSTFNSASVTSTETDAGREGTRTSNNSVQENTTVRTRTDVQVRSKTVDAPGTFSLRDEFNYTIRTSVNVVAGLSEADDVFVNDTLPAGMELTGTPTLNVVAGSITNSTCTGTAGQTSFSCDFGTFQQNFAPAADGIVDITVPVRVVSITADPATLTNTASITTSSLDAVTTNNEADGDVTINASNISGTLYRDFDDDGTQEAGDTPVAGVQITLTGVASNADGSTTPIAPITVTTDANGNYDFGLLPEGTYTITRGTVSEAHQTDGGSYPFGGNGTSTSDTVIGNVSVGDNDTAPNNDFTVVPTARIGIAKRTRGDTIINADGSFDQQFRLRIENFSLETLDNIEVTDTLEGLAPSFGTYSGGALAPGQYTVITSPNENCAGGTAVATFTGAGSNTVLASGMSLNPGATCRIDFTIRVQPTNPLPPFVSGTDRYLNQATVTGEGVLSGQTSATNPSLSDLSDNGGNPDANGNGLGSDANENDPTPVGPVFEPEIAIVKTADTSAFSSPPAEGDIITYSFEVTNTGPLNLFDVNVTDPLVGLSINNPNAPSPFNIGDLNAGASRTITGTYALTQADIDSGGVVNTATVEGEDIYGTSVEDDSGTANDNNTPTDTPIQRVPSIALIKTADGSGVQNPTFVGDDITYSFSVRNTGNVTLTNVIVTDGLPGLVLTVNPAAVAQLATMLPGDEITNAYTATYDVTADDINNATVDNQAEVTADSPDPANPVVTDDSGDTFGDDNPVSVPLFPDPQIALIKTSTTTRLQNPPQEGDVLDFQFEVTNTGNVTLSNITISDLLPGVTVNGGPITLEAGESDSSTFRATYLLTQDNLNDGFVENLATVSGTPPSGPAVTDDSGTDNTNDVPLITPLDQVSDIDLVKLADTSAFSTPPADGDTLTYIFEVTNTGNQTLSNITLTDTLPGIMLSGGPIATLEPGVTDSVTFSGTYVIDQDDIDGGSITNFASVTGTDPDGVDVDADDELVTSLNQNPDIAVVKTVDTSGLSSPPQVGETLVYNFTVTNTGNVRLINVTVTDPLPDLVLTGSPIPLMEPGDIDSTTYRAEYVLKPSDVDFGSVTNQADVVGTDPIGVPIEDRSGDTNAVDNPLTVPLDRQPSIAVVKTADDSAFSDPVQAGDVVTFNFTITNTGNVTLTDIRLADVLPDIVISGGPIPVLTTLAEDPAGAVDATTYTATYALKQSDIDLGRVENQATATATPPFIPDITDISGTENGNDDPTILPLQQEPSITIDKIADLTAFEDGSVPGESILYSFTVTNTGNVTLTNVTVTDALPGVVLTGGPIPTMAPGNVDTTTYTAEYVIDQADVDAGLVTNTASVTGDYTDATGSPAQVSDSDTEESPVANIEALPETFPPIGTNGGVTTSVLGSDTLINDPATLDNVTITVLTSDPEITLDPTTGLITVPPGTPAGTYTVTYEICSIDLPDICDSTTETVVQLALLSIETTKTQELIDNGDGFDGVGDTVRYTITVENTGNVPVTDLVLDDTFTAIDGTVFTLTTGPTFQSADAGSLEGDLEIGETATYVATFILDIDTVTIGGLENTVLATALPVYPADVPGTPSEVSDRSDDGLDNDGNVTDDPTVLLISPTLQDSAQLTLTKTTTADVVLRGQQVPYTITLTNGGPAAAGPLDIVDTLPRGLLYLDGSATYEGTSASVTIDGAVVTWEDLVVPPFATVTATLTATVLPSAGTGSFVNVADAIDPSTGQPVTPSATATVRINPEPVFDCGEVIGKVFNDRNGNGYQDGPQDRSGAITDQNYYGSKGGKLSPEPAPTDEPGIPAARFVTVDGTVITTDEFGRFSIPCAALPVGAGTNYILKLDTSSLPAGFRMTTENPRVMRMTPGRMVEMNFGASISQLVRIELNRNGFVQASDGTDGLSPGLAQSIRAMLQQIAGTPSHVRLAYHVSAQADRAEVAQARAHMTLVQSYIDQEWQDVGRVKLTTEQAIARPDQ